MQLTGGALERLQAITPAGCEAQIDLTLTDEGPTGAGHCHHLGGARRLEIAVPATRSQIALDSRR